MTLNYDFNRHWQVGATVDMTQTKANYPGTTQAPLLDMWTYVKRGTASLRVSNHYNIVNGGLQVYGNWGRNRVDDGHAPTAEPTDYIFNSTDYNVGFTLYETVNPWRDNDLSAGVDFVHWGGHNWNAGKETGERSAEFRHCINEIAGYIMMQQGFWHDLLSLNAGVRLQHSGQYGNEWIPQAGFILKPYKGGSLRFNFAKGFRAPNMRELYLYMPANPDLKPEYSLNYDVEFRQILLDGRLNFGLSLFFIDGKDMIQMEMIDGRRKNMNVGRFINKGFEIDAAWRIARDWNISANYSYLHTDAKILGAPKNKLNAELNYTPRSWEFTVQNENIWSLYTGDPAGNHSYSLLNLKAAYTYGTRVPITFFVKADNITNKHYEVIYGCPMPGITLMGGVQVKF